MRVKSLGSTSPFTVRAGLSADGIPTPAELSITVRGNAVTFQPFTDQHIVSWRLGTEPDIHSLIVQGDSTFANQWGGWTLYAGGNITVSNLVGRAWVSNQLLTIATAQTYIIH